MWIKFTNPTFYYIDPNQEQIENVWDDAAHDGSSVVKAARVLPATLQDNTVYLIRRSTAEDGNENKWVLLTQPIKTAEGANHVAIIGMPKATDDLYSYMPTDAKTAWGSDTEERAVIAEDENYYTDDNFVSLTARGACFMNIEFKQRFKNWNGKHSNSTVTTNSWSWALYFISESIIVSGCKFVLIGNDLEKDQHNNFSNDNYYLKALHRIHLGYKTSCLFENNIFVISPQSSQGRNTHQIYFTTKDGNAVVRNITVHNTGVRIDDIKPVFDFTEDSAYKRDNVKIYNITEYLHKCTTSDSTCIHLRNLIGGWFFSGSIYDITVQFANNDTVATHYPIIDRTHIYTNIRSNTFNIHNITVNIPECNGAANVFSFWKSYVSDDTSSRHAPIGQWIIIKDVTAIFCDYGVSGFDGGGSTILSVGNDNYNRNSMNYPNHQSTCNQIILQNVNIKASMAGSDCLALDAYFTLVNMEFNDIEGRVRFFNCIGTIGKIKSYFTSNAFLDSGYNLIYCDGITCNRNNPDNPYTGQPALSPSWLSNILVKSTNTLFIADDNLNEGPGNNINAMYVCSSNQSEGQFTVRNHKCKAEAWSVNRTGGHQCSLRLSCQLSDASSTPLVIGTAPFKGIAMPLKAGLNKCTFYFTCYGYNNFDEIVDKIRIKAIKPDGTAIGADAGQWEKDTTSEWNNIDDNESYKYTMYINMEEAGTVEFSYFFWWYMKNAYTFVDPFPIIEHID